MNEIGTLLKGKNYVWLDPSIRLEGQFGQLFPTTARCQTCTGFDSDSKVEFGLGLVIAGSMVNEFMQVQTESVMNMNDTTVEVGAAEARWSTPPRAYCKVNVDASWERGSKLATSAIEAEAHVALSGVHLAAQMGISHVVFESDSKELVQSAKGHIQRSRWTIFPILTAIRRACSGFSSYSWNWVHRGANKAADAAASRAKSRMCDEVWESSLPSSLVFVLQADGLLYPTTM
ncbi:unnamed protein product [Prunus armeniaca]